MNWMKNRLGSVSTALLSLLCIAGGALLFAHHFPEDLIWNLFGAVLMFTGASAILSKIVMVLHIRKGRV